MKAYIGKDNTWGALITDGGQGFLFTFTANGSGGAWDTLPALLPAVDMEEVSPSKMFEILGMERSEAFKAHQSAFNDAYNLDANELDEYREKIRKTRERINRNKNH